MCVYMYECLCMCVSIWMFMCMYVCILYMSVCMGVCIWMFMCICVRVYVCVGVFVYVCLWVLLFCNHCLWLVYNASILFDCCSFSVSFEMVNERSFSSFVFYLLCFVLFSPS